MTLQQVDTLYMFEGLVAEQERLYITEITEEMQVDERDELQQRHLLVELVVQILEELHELHDE